ncbi:MAG: glycosyltransferase family 2 protein [Gluconacetobacter diazotrophicus]|nr:glycosyltransferase family 2 protein [Gluconacetobacter diazotrophicus]
MEPFLRTHRHPDLSLQDPFDVAVVIPTVLRPGLVAALRSVLAQHAPDRIQVLVGIDHPGEDPHPVREAVSALCAELPPRVAVQLLHPGYSTSVRHGGLVAARDGGALRTVLTHLANSRHVAYLDDDNAWTPDHLSTLLAALHAGIPGTIPGTSGGADWAWSLRWFTDPDTARPLAVDRWESVGPGAGEFAARFGGFCDPNTLLIDRERCREAIVAWTTPLPDDPDGMSADRMVFDRLRSLRGVATGRPTALYRLNPADGRHSIRMRQLAATAAS